MMQFRKKPVVIDAIRYDGTWKSVEKIVKSFGMARPINWNITIGKDVDGNLVVLTLEGAMKANPGDWIIKGVAGEIYPCKPDIFDATYEAVGYAPSQQVPHNQTNNKEGI